MSRVFARITAGFALLTSVLLVGSVAPAQVPGGIPVQPGAAGNPLYATPNSPSNFGPAYSPFSTPNVTRDPSQFTPGFTTSAPNPGSVGAITYGGYPSNVSPTQPMRIDIEPPTITSPNLSPVYPSPASPPGVGTGISGMGDSTAAGLGTGTSPVGQSPATTGSDASGPATGTSAQP